MIYLYLYLFLIYLSVGYLCMLWFPKWVKEFAGSIELVVMHLTWPLWAVIVIFVTSMDAISDWWLGRDKKDTIKRFYGVD